MDKVYECVTCGIVSKNERHLCNPAETKEKDYCGHSSTLQTAMMCAEETRRLDYVCGRCGRPAEKPELLCSPRDVG